MAVNIRGFKKRKEEGKKGAEKRSKVIEREENGGGICNGN